MFELSQALPSDPTTLTGMRTEAFVGLTVKTDPVGRRWSDCLMFHQTLLDMLAEY
jgi:hypothetical protein